MCRTTTSAKNILIGFPFMSGGSLLVRGCKPPRHRVTKIRRRRSLKSQLFSSWCLGVLVIAFWFCWGLLLAAEFKPCPGNQLRRDDHVPDGALQLRVVAQQDVGDLAGQ